MVRGTGVELLVEENDSWYTFTYVDFMNEK